MEVPVTFSNLDEVELEFQGTHYYRFTTKVLFDGTEREYVVVPSLHAWYGKRNNGSYRLMRLDGITQV